MVRVRVTGRRSRARAGHYDHAAIPCYTVYHCHSGCPSRCHWHELVIRLRVGISSPAAAPGPAKSTGVVTTPVDFGSGLSERPVSV
eukprot:3220953-Rhodomonas_salina.1